MADFAYIPFGIPGGEQEVAEVAEVIGSGWITTGPRVARVRDRLRHLRGVRRMRWR